MLTHIDLFSGIGGFALAAQWAGFRTEVFCEIEPFCQEVLRARFGAVADAPDNGCDRDDPSCRMAGWKSSNKEQPGDRWTGGGSGCNSKPILIPDIRDFDGRRFRGATLLTAGVPCQPASIDGKRRGTSDDRWLWPEALRILAEVKPTWAIFENPCGILSLESGMVFENLLSQMEAEGYEVQPLVIPACAVNAPHRRSRVWIIAYNGRDASELGLPRKHGGRTGKEFKNGYQDATNAEGRSGRFNEAEFERRRNYPRQTKFHAPDAEECGRGQEYQNAGRNGEGMGAPGEWRGSSDSIRDDATDDSRSGGARSRMRTRPSDEAKDEPWSEVATRLCRVDDGLPAWIHSRRTERLKALGNAIVPQIAYEIIKAIGEIECQ